MDEREPYNADSPDAARHAVRELRKYGAQVIKICATGGVFSRNTEPGQQQMTYEEMKAVADDAHMYGLKVAAHAHGASGIKDAIRAGIDTIEHASLIDDEGITLAKKHGTYLSMDIYNTEYTQSEGRKNGVLEDNLRKDREVADIQVEIPFDQPEERLLLGAAGLAAIYVGGKLILPGFVDTHVHYPQVDVIGSPPFDAKGRRNVMVLIKKVNVMLDEMAQQILQEQSENIRLLEMVDDIRGMLVDIFF